ncbi:peptidyl-alpha-hydroxyglycine alpha-amidating lyase family protein [Neolewinella agarilytica]|uniref:6-bladed beta-propeller protein n=1 Tax=Neolewinella agarilytica TaxID=478744 RepID=A0A1H9D1N1_9BACT|nr:peptidyl-alpha-hydroxyglycine alpha-amidating lyase family protein [Neolewinella agarilytica]SEQ07344.1 6-bladed beta-propeller protein [Neolewinella agarilytica]
MRTFIFLLLVTILGAAAGCNESVQEQGEPAPGPLPEYVLSSSWPSDSTAATIGQPVGVGLMPDGSVAVFHRGKGTPNPHVADEVVVFIDPDSGEIINSWGEDSFIHSHGMHVDWAGNVWLTDIKRHQVFKYSAEGQLLLSLGTAGEAGLDNTHFDQPTDVAVSPEGDIFVTDGYGNRRIVKFSANGDFLLDWGKKGEAPGEFVNPHSIDISKEGVLYVTDRENHRIQTFDTQGNFLDTIPTGGAVYACIVDERKEELLATDFQKQDTTILGSDVFLMGLSDSLPSDAFIGHSHDGDRAACQYHDLTRDAEGNIYLVDLIGKRVEKWVLK